MVKVIFDSKMLDTSDKPWDSWLDSEPAEAGRVTAELDFLYAVYPTDLDTAGGER